MLLVLDKELGGRWDHMDPRDQRAITAWVTIGTVPATLAGAVAGIMLGALWPITMLAGVIMLVGAYLLRRPDPRPIR